MAALKTAADAIDKGKTGRTAAGTKEETKTMPLGAGTQSAQKSRGGGSRSSGGGENPVYVGTAVRSEVTPQVDPYWETQLRYYETIYSDALRQSSEAAERAAAAARQEAERQSAALTREYDGLNRQLYRDYMESRRTLPLSLAAQGYTGGVSESARVRLQNGYEEALAGNLRERISKMSDVEYERARAEEAARSAAEERNADALRTYQQGLMTLARQRHSEDRSDELRRAEVLARAGDFSGYRALGWTEGEIAYLSAMWAAQHPNVAAWASYGNYAG